MADTFNLPGGGGTGTIFDYNNAITNNNPYAANPGLNQAVLNNYVQKGYVAAPNTPSTNGWQPSYNTQATNQGLPTIGGNTSGGGGGSAPQQQSQPSQPAFDPYAQLRGEINSGWDSYLGNLNDISNNYLPQQQQAQQGVADTQLSAGQNAVNSQKAQSLRDIAANMRNSFQAGNNYLGTRGAGDSSAANQYQFALTQEGNKQTGNLNNFVNTQLNQLQSQHDTQINQIAQWFAGQQQALKQQIAQGGLGRSQDLQSLSTNILNQAIQAANQIKSQTSTQYNNLLNWAQQNAGNLSQVQGQIAGIPQQVNTPQVDSQGNYTVPVGAGNFGSTPSSTDIFGNKQFLA